MESEELTEIIEKADMKELREYAFNPKSDWFKRLRTIQTMEPSIASIIQMINHYDSYMPEVKDGLDDKFKRVFEARVSFVNAYNQFSQSATDPIFEPLKVNSDVMFQFVSEAYITLIQALAYQAAVNEKLRQEIERTYDNSGTLSDEQRVNLQKAYKGLTDALRSLEGMKSLYEVKKGDE